MTVAEEVEAPVEPDLKGAEGAEAEGVDEPGRASLPIAFDLACMRCQYNLRTLHAEAACPECGQPVAETLAAFRRGWRREGVLVWRKGCRWIGFSGLLTAASPITVLTGFYVGSLFDGSFGAVTMMLMVAGFVLAEHLLWVMGVWRLTAGHPGAEQAATGLINGLRVMGSLHGFLAAFSVLLPIFFAIDEWIGSYVIDDELWLLWGLIVAATVTARAGVVGGLMRLLGKTLGVGGHLWKRRHLLITGTVVIILCVAQATATLATMSDAYTAGDDLIYYGMVVGGGSIFALPVIAIWSAVSVFRAGVAFKLPKD